MKERILTIATAIGLAGLLGFAAYGVVAQTPVVPKVLQVFPDDLFQDVVHGQPTAQSFYATAAQIGAASGTQSLVPITGFTIQVANGTTYLFLNPAGTLATGTITFPVMPSDGQHLCIFDTQIQTAVTIAAATGTSLSGTTISAFVASTQYCWRYIAATSTWYYQGSS